MMGAPAANGQNAAAGTGGDPARPGRWQNLTPEQRAARAAELEKLTPEERAERRRQRRAAREAGAAAQPQ
ncbi:MAG TPA: hypothetical protein VGD76_13725, partial [Ramlibacter sp.]